jgi:hypothetical protein
LALREIINAIHRVVRFCGRAEGQYAVGVATKWWFAVGAERWKHSLAFRAPKFAAVSLHEAQMDPPEAHDTSGAASSGCCAPLTAVLAGRRAGSQRVRRPAPGWARAGMGAGVREPGIAGRSSVHGRFSGIAAVSPAGRGCLLCGLCLQPGWSCWHFAGPSCWRWASACADRGAGPPLGGARIRKRTGRGGLRAARRRQADKRDAPLDCNAHDW